MSAPSTDLSAMKQILTGLTKAGYSVVRYIDDTWNKDEVTECSDPVKAAEAMNEVDEGFVILTTPEGDEGWIYFVLGNEPEEVACNYTTNLDPTLDTITRKWWEW